MGGRMMSEKGWGRGMFRGKKLSKVQAGDLSPYICRGEEMTGLGTYDAGLRRGLNTGGATADSPLQGGKTDPEDNISAEESYNVLRAAQLGITWIVPPVKCIYLRF